MEVKAEVVGSNQKVLAITKPRANNTWLSPFLASSHLVSWIADWRLSVFVFSIAVVSISTPSIRVILCNKGGHKSIYFRRRSTGQVIHTLIQISKRNLCCCKVEKAGCMCFRKITGRKR